MAGSATNSKDKKAEGGDAAASKPDEAKVPKTPIEVIEEDDEFEEFAENNWGAGEEDAEDTQQWQDNWDADDMDDDFTKSLREELMKNSS